jgi:hypothetical protein
MCRDLKDFIAAPQREVTTDKAESIASTAKEPYTAKLELVPKAESLAVYGPSTTSQGR